ncbi:helix-turn-helix transcriptional regulator [Streptomyces sp. R302]|nr:helix-turn-helix transcriptional regulator [Streptomyces sp. R301]NML81094.1 helix-turn-helix transcriptional regulator [Streptomyces sp. R302]
MGLLLGAAERLFGERGYASTSLDAVVAAAGVTKGAVYHHFRNKAALFREVFVRQQKRVAAELEQAAARAPDAGSALRGAARLFLERCMDRRFQRIALLDAGAVLGWAAAREIEREHTLRVLQASMREAAPGALDPETLAVRCQMIFAALQEAGMLLARSAEPEQVLVTVTREAERLLAPFDAPRLR